MKSKISIIVGFFFLSFAGILSGQTEIESKVLQLSDQLRCPTCQGISVKESESKIAITMKNEIRRLLQSGKDEQAVLDYFEERYGEWILRNPRATGLNYSLWLMPIIISLMGFGLIVFIFIKNK